MLIKIFLFCVFLTLNCSVFAANSDTLDPRYTQAVNYIYEYNSIKNKLLQIFKTSDQPKISSTIIFLSHAPVCVRPNDSCQLILNDDEKNINDFDSKHYFKPFEDKLLGKLSRPQQSKLVSYFSKPVNNFLVCRIYLSNGDRDAIMDYRGDALQLIFVFDKQNKIENVLVNTIIIN